MRLSEQRRDGPIWTLDCAEIFLDPEAAGSKYLHFIAAPVKGAYYDSRRGYIDDALNPLYGKADPSWNPDWQYAFVVDAGKKQWTIEAQMPFASLGVAAPTPGTRWKANFGRERCAAMKAEKGEPELFLWSPNELGTGFAEQLCFGDVYFEKGPTK